LAKPLQKSDFVIADKLCHVITILKLVIPAKAGIQKETVSPQTGFRRNDDKIQLRTVCLHGGGSFDFEQTLMVSL
jgi:hypothetical protein